MSFQVAHDRGEDCIFATLSGELSSEVVSAFFTEVLKVAEESNCGRLLSDLRDATIAVSAGDMYRMAEALGKKKVHKLQRRAIVVSRDQELYGFWETVCANQGHRNVRVFEDHDEAKRWATGAG